MHGSAPLGSCVDVRSIGRISSVRSRPLSTHYNAQVYAEANTTDFNEAIDHVVWVTMTKNGPKIANLLLNGIIDQHGPVAGDLTVEHGMYEPVIPTEPPR